MDNQQHATDPKSGITLLFSNYTNFSGIATRADCWYAVAFNAVLFVAYLILSTLFGALGGFGHLFALILSLAAFLYVLALIIPTIALITRHNRGIGLRGGWLAVVTIIAVFSTLVTVILFLIPNRNDDDNIVAK